MAFDATVYKVMIASPSDVTHLRPVIAEVMHDWNDEHSEEKNIALLPIRWERHSAPQLGDRGQEILNTHLVKTSDILIAVFWGKFGSDTGKEPSGTLEEIKGFLDDGKLVMLYFCEAPIPPKDIDSEQLKKVRELQKKLQDHSDQRLRGIYHSFSNEHQLREDLRRHLSIHARRLKKPADISKSQVNSNQERINEEVVRNQQQSRIDIERSNFESRVLASAFHNFSMSAGVMALSIIPSEPTSKRLPLNDKSDAELNLLLVTERNVPLKPGISRFRNCVAVIHPYIKERSPDKVTEMTDRGSIFAAGRLFELGYPAEQPLLCLLAKPWESLVDAVHLFTKTLRFLEIAEGGYLSVGISLLGAQYLLAVPEMTQREKWKLIGRPSGNSEIRLEPIEIPAKHHQRDEIRELLYPAFKDIWFEFGYNAVPRFNSDGAFIGF